MPDAPPRSGRASAQSHQAEDAGALQLYLFGVDAGQLHDVAERLDVTSQVSSCRGWLGSVWSFLVSAVHLRNALTGQVLYKPPLEQEHCAAAGDADAAAAGR